MQRSINIVKNITIVDSTDNYIQHAKTGGAEKKDGTAIGWYVGYIETKDNVYIFALNVDGSGFNEVAKLRIELTMNVFKELGILKGD